MTDTRKEFEQAMRFSEEFRDGNIYQFSFMTAAWKSWQACQSLNDKRIENYKSAYETWQDKTEWVQETSTAKELGLHRADVLKKRIEQLLAVIEKQRELFYVIADYAHKPDFVMSQVNEALALQPADVELVDASTISDAEWDRYKSTGEGVKLYTIKTKAAK